MASTTPPSSSCLFFPSSPAQGSISPAEEVADLVAQALQQQWLDPAHEARINRNQDDFFNDFVDRIELIKSRSQAISRGRICVFDKALLELTQNGKNLTSPPALAFYCEQQLGIPPSAGLSERQQGNTGAIALSPAPKRVTAPLKSQSRPSSARTIGSSSPEKKKLIKTTMEEKKPAVLAALAAKVDSPTLRLWSMFERAKREYDNVEEPTSIEKQETAKFLRDTAENALHYLRDKNPDRRLVDELEITFSAARHKAMTLHGGKKRKFDHPVPSRDHSRLPETRLRQPDPVYATEVDDRYERQGRETTRKRNDQVDLFDGHDRGSRRWDHRDSEDHTRYRQSFAAPELSPRGAGVPNRKKQQRGRGHSGIPFGYSRAVDSYQPR